MGAKAGSENVTLTVNQLPSHNHDGFQASSAPGSSNEADDKTIANSPSVTMYIEDTPSVNMASPATTTIGGSRSHTNLQPFLCIHFIIALVGIYPSRN